MRSGSALTHLQKKTTITPTHKEVAHAGPRGPASSGVDEDVVGEPGDAVDGESCADLKVRGDGHICVFAMRM